MIDALKQPWPWYVAGPLIGLMVPLLLLTGNKAFGISANLRHICAACFPAGISFFRYDWKKEAWNLLFVAGIAVGAFIASHWFANPAPVIITPELTRELAQYGISNDRGLLPSAIFSWQGLFTVRGFILMVIGGFLVGFGTRYAGGCTSGHAITGLSTLQWPSLIATVMFMIGGLVTANFVLPIILKL